MKDIFEKNEKLIKKYKKNFINIYCWIILIIFLTSLGFFIYSSIKNFNIFNFYNFFNCISPSIINGLVYLFLRYTYKKQYTFFEYIYFIGYLFAIYSFRIFFDYHIIIMILPIAIILSEIILLDYLLIKKQTIIIIFLNLLFSCFLYFICNYNLKNLIISFSFSTVLLLVSKRISYLIINYIKDYLKDNTRSLKNQEILHQNIHKAVNDLKIEPMTKLLNKRAMNELIDVKINNFNTRGINVLVALIDLDFFKKVNDTYGHDIGDKVLIDLANFLKTKLPKNINIFRFGGEEFVILFDNYSEKEVYEMLEYIRISFSKKKFKYMDNQALTLSIGFTEIKKDDTKDSLIKRADTALYKSKNNGRNKTTKY